MAEELDRGRIAVAPVDRRRTEGGTANGVRQAERGAANRHRSRGESADGHAQTDGGTTEREQQTERQTADVIRPQARPPIATPPTAMLPIAMTPFATRGRMVTGSMPAQM